MANKAGTKESKVTSRKTAPATATKTAARKSATATASKAKSRTAANKINKGDVFACEICGLQVYVDEFGEILETTALYCCDEPMKKTGTAKAAKK